MKSIETLTLCKVGCPAISAHPKVLEIAEILGKYGNNGFA